VKRAASEDLTDPIEQARQGDEMAVYQVLGEYERRLSDEWAQEDGGDYWGFHRHPGDTQPWIDSMSYGWGIGHPNHPFEEIIETVVDGEYEIWASTAIEHAMHADQHAATTLLEDLFAADLVSDPAQLLRIVGAIDRGYYPDSSDLWDWETLYPEYQADGFDWDPDVRDRLRAVVVDCGLARQLPDDWSFTDIVL